MWEAPLADKTNSTATTPRPYRSASSPQLLWLQESTTLSSAIIRYGDVVQMDVNVGTANHRVVKASTMANVPNVISTALLGIAVSVPDSPASTATATAPGSTEQGRLIGILPASRRNEFLFPTKSSGVLSSVFGTRRALGYDSTLSMFYVDIGNSTAADATVMITDIPEPGTDANNPCVVRFISTNTHRVVGSF